MLHLSARQRGALWLLLALVAGRILDRLDMPFDASHWDPAAAADSAAVAVDSIGVVPEKSSKENVPSPAASEILHLEATPSTRIAINQASAAELQALPRVGPVLAARIVAHRENNGPFRSLQDLRQVPGIGPRTAAQLAPLLRFD